ncbi:heparan-alpha-glucosaminide N-acetyltransferase-like [Macadamia integrifolia]|uniref:heparan-alpha-glucosaminide N-acetyltransferase-like n=1 Tax=Macadamia integrifolia TaxID=60698 RepID=UPI001C4FA006|nr:heparan-alpha-glucosaminide N-acetyltransferase-like [Macadamia integrifolia]
MKTMYELIKGEDNPNSRKTYTVKDIEGGGGGGDASTASTSKKHQSQRLASLDVFRGVTVATMIFVDHAGGLFPVINHSPWNGITLADFVFPFFLFIVGVSLALAYKKPELRCTATKKSILRAMKLSLLGLLLQGGYLHRVFDLSYGVDLTKIRLMGILQRIAIAYLVSALCEIWLKSNEEDMENSRASHLLRYRFQWIVAFTLSTIYLILLYYLYVPDWEFQINEKGSLKTFKVNCGVRGDTGPACNAAGMIDRRLLGIPHLYSKPVYARTEQCSINSPDYGPLPSNAPSWCQAPFDPEGLLSSVMGIVSCLIGLHFGHIIVHFREHKERVLNWMIPASILVVFGFMLNLSGMHFNKALYSLSYMCVTTGVAGIFLAGTYMLVDVYGWRRPTMVMELLGKHALLIFILAASNVVPIFLQGFYWKKPENNILRLIIGS